MRPTRETIRSNEDAYFVSTQTDGRKPFFRNDRCARLMLNTINHYAETGYKLRAYAIMPDHLHLLISPTESLEKSVQLIKGSFSFRAKKELEWKGEIGQPGFTDHRIRDEEDWARHREYIRTNPINAGLVKDSSPYEFVGYPDVEFPRWLKPTDFVVPDVRAEARTLQTEARSLRTECSKDLVQESGQGAAKAAPFKRVDEPGKARTFQPPHQTA